MGNYVIGIDGGGTKTVVITADMKGRKEHRFVAGPLNLNGQRKEEVYHSFKVMMGTMHDLGYSREDCKGICIGTAGVSNPAAEELIREMAAQVFGRNKIIITGDHETALVGALGDRNGVILIAGTGSICYGVDISGNSYRAGGYGHIIDDVGSGYAIGREILVSVIRAYDKRKPETMLTQLLFETLHIKSIEEMIHYVYDPARSKKEIAALSIILSQGVESGDEASLEILDRVSKDLIELAAPVIEQVGRACVLAVSGSVLLNNQELYSLFRKYLSVSYPDVLVVMPREEAAYGAVKIILDNETPW